jgi:hypothetical protein
MMGSTGCVDTGRGKERMRVGCRWKTACGLVGLEEWRLSTQKNDKVTELQMNALQGDGWGAISLF